MSVMVTGIWWWLFGTEVICDSTLMVFLMRLLYLGLMLQHIMPPIMFVGGVPNIVLLLKLIS